MIGVLSLTFAFVLFLAPCLRAAVFPSHKPEWSVDFGGTALGLPVHFGPVERTEGVLVTTTTGQVFLVTPDGQKRLLAKLEHAIETPAVAADLDGNGKLCLVAVDSSGSVHCFEQSGQRRWKFNRNVKSGEFRLPVFADMDGDGKLEVLVADSRGHIDVLDARGRLRLEIKATDYRLSVPGVGDIDGDGKPEIIFATEAGDVYCLNAQADLRWCTTLDGCFGRALPLIADAEQDGHYEVYFSTAFDNAHPGLFALDARSGRQLWKAPSHLQCYRSTVVADLDGNGRNQVLFGDKNSTLFCLDADGHQRWATQLDGRGIFFAPVIASLEGNGATTIFVVVRAAGAAGNSLYALNSRGTVLDAVPLTGGGGASPILCRFTGESGLSLVALSAGGQLVCYRFEQNAAAAKILWAGVRNDPLNSGFVKSSSPVEQRLAVTSTTSAAKSYKHGKERALGGTNHLPLHPAPASTRVVAIKTLCPDGSVRVELLRPESGVSSMVPSFTASIPGDYEITARCFDSNSSTCDHLLQSEHFSYRLDHTFSADAARLRVLSNQLASGLQPELRHICEQTSASGLQRARNSRDPADFDEFHRSCGYFQELAACCRRQNDSCGLVVKQLPNPWENFNSLKFLRGLSYGSNFISAHLLGNEYQSAAIALVNFDATPVTIHFSCGAFVCGTNQVAASQVVELRDVVRVRPNGTDEPSEDPLPSLGEGQIVRLAPGETHKVWMTFRSQKLTPGTWHAVVKVGDVVTAERPQEVPVVLEVYPVSLPERFTYRECNWLYLHGIADEHLREVTLRDALEHGMNVFVLPGVTVKADEQGKLTAGDTATHDQLVQKLRGHAFFLVSGPVSVQWPAQAHPSAALQEQTFAAGLRWYAEHMRSLGCDYDDYAIYVQDEPGLLGRDANFSAFVGRVKQFKAAEPRMELYANPAGGARADLLQPLEDLIDVWAPALDLLRQQPEELGQIFRKAKHYWHYEAPGDQRRLDPLGFYRLKPWVAFQLGMTGGGYWVYSQDDYWSDSPGGGSEYGTVYPTEQGPVTTKRWEGSREGIQDFELLWLLRKRAREHPGQASQRALALLEEAVSFVTRGQDKVSDISRQVHPYTPDYQRWMDYRRRLIEAEVQLEQRGER